jgi:hypothetical protein
MGKTIASMTTNLLLKKSQSYLLDSSKPQPDEHQHLAQHQNHVKEMPVDLATIQQIAVNPSQQSASLKKKWKEQIKQDNHRSTLRNMKGGDDDV